MIVNGREIKEGQTWRWDSGIVHKVIAIDDDRIIVDTYNDLGEKGLSGAVSLLGSAVEPDCKFVPTGVCASCDGVADEDYLCDGCRHAL